MATKVALKVIPKPEKATRSVLYTDPPRTVIIRGEKDARGPFTYVCGECSAPLAETVHGDMLTNLVLKCNRCGRYNETLRT
jgi:DNA-directed RNA polymerase subunit RPC12/RpoP